MNRTAKCITAFLMAFVLLTAAACGKEPVDEHAGQVYVNDGFNDVWITPVEDVKVNPLVEEDFTVEEEGKVRYTGDFYSIKLGVDVSYHQFDIDWSRVPGAGIEFAIIRVGYRGYTVGSVFPDEYYEANLRGAIDNGLDVGVYFFSQAISVEEAREEARFVLDNLNGQVLDMPIVFDWEFVPDEDARTANISREMLNSCAIAFCEEVKAAGYQPMVYFNPDLAYRILDLQLMQKQGYPFWLAMYANALTYPHRVEIWQYTSGATVMGIDTPVDLNLLFIYDEKDAA